MHGPPYLARTVVGKSTQPMFTPFAPSRAEAPSASDEIDDNEDNNEAANLVQVDVTTSLAPTLAIPGFEGLTKHQTNLLVLEFSQVIAFCLNV